MAAPHESSLTLQLACWVGSLQWPSVDASCCSLLSLQTQKHSLSRHTDTPEYVLNENTPSNLVPTLGQQRTSASALRQWNRRHGLVAGSALQLGLDIVQSLNSASQQKLWVLGAPIFEQVEPGDVPVEREHRQSLDRPLSSTDNSTAMQPLEGATSSSNPHYYNSTPTDFHHTKDEVQEGVSSTIPSRGWPPHSPTRLSQQPFQRKRGYMFPNPSDSHNERGVELAEGYAKQGVKQEGIASSHNALWLPPIEGDAQEEYCSCFPHCSTTVNCQTATDSFSWPFTIWSQSNSFMDLLNKTFPQTHMTHITPSFPVSTERVQMQVAGSRMIDKLFSRGTQQSNQKLPTSVKSKKLMVIGHRVYTMTENPRITANTKTPQVCQPHSLSQVEHLGT